MCAEPEENRVGFVTVTVDILTHPIVSRVLTSCLIQEAVKAG